MANVNSKRGGPLQGVRVVELSKVWAGPETGKHFAFLGAEVIKIESQGAIDLTRYDSLTGDINKARGFQSVNPQKLSAQINMKSEKGIQLILDLLKETDILVENLRPGAMDRLGLGYDVARKINPGLVYISMGMYGNDGPLAYQTGYAPCFNAVGGLSALVGYEGQAPTGINVRYADSTYGTAAAYAGLVALLHSRRTGVGQFVDVSACETMTGMIADTVMEYTMNGVEHACDGNRHAEMAPHGVYPCQGEDWISIAVSSDEAWSALADVMGLAGDDRFASLASRTANIEELDRLVGEWTKSQDVGELVAALQNKGIAAGKSQNTLDLISDQTFWQRGFYPDVTEFDGETKTIVGPGAKMTRGAAITDGAPKLGDHTDYVLGEILGLSEEEQKKLNDEGIMS
ncbi:CaiB/BaiF CoA transferase family protein [Emcibacter nanhaiensis]|uniref:CoA transferase n=1 Tax=Emcibacter nanhaiensis TaxID=1505037 RepID=A0A501PIG6_9PROT|nr:CoA transferase [Emcibacter nanhaiensis]TPD59897.1 CoA transferase [Emcibacter nanhaiensis]